MKRLFIICEGQTEQEFCKTVLQEYFKQNITISPPLIKKSGGGIVAWKYLKSQINKHLKQEKKAYVTTFIDYYGIKDKHKFPKWEESRKIADKPKRIDCIENAMQEDVDKYRFIPYIQLHEFEGLLFNNITVFQNRFEAREYNQKK